MANEKETQESNSETLEINEGFARGVVLFLVGLITLLSLSLFIFYSTVRARSIGIASGYLKAIEISYESGELKIGKEPNEKTFETGIYNVRVTTSRFPDQNESIVVKVEVKDKFFSVTQYTEELKLIPTIEPEAEQG